MDKESLGIQMLDDKPDDHESHSAEEIEEIGIVMMLGLLVVYVAVGSYMEHKQFKFGHETGAIILIGIIFSIIIW